MSYIGSVVLVTGGNTGIGRAFVERFAREEALVIACGRNPTTLAGLEADLPQVDVRQADIGVPGDIHKLVNHIARSYGRLDVLVNNAAVMHASDLLSGQISDDEVLDLVRINLGGPILLSKASLPLLRNGRHPMIINVTSGFALHPSRRAPLYSATKAGLRSFTRALRYQLEGTDVRVVDVVPAYVDTAATAAISARKQSPSAAVDETLRGIAHGRDEVFLGQAKWLSLLDRVAPWAARRLLKNA